MESNNSDGGNNSGIIYAKKPEGIVTATGEENVHAFLVKAQEGDLILDFVKDRIRALRVPGSMVDTLILAVTAFVRRTLNTPEHVNSPSSPVMHDGGLLTELFIERVPEEELFAHAMRVGDEGLKAYAGIRRVPSAFSPNDYRSLGREVAISKYTQAVHALPDDSLLGENIATLTHNLYPAAVVVADFMKATPPPQLQFCARRAAHA